MFIKKFLEEGNWTYRSYLRFLQEEIRDAGVFLHLEVKLPVLLYLLTSMMNCEHLLYDLVPDLSSLLALVLFQDL